MKGVNCMSIISYVPSIINVASVFPSTVESTTLINGNLPIVENGFIVGETVPQKSAVIEWLIAGVAWIGKNVIAFLATDGETVFILIAILGIFCMMGGFKKLGTKMTSGSILGYIICKVVTDVCQQT